jgi:hypothetical protein
MADKTVTIENVKCKKETDRALLCIIEGEEVWIPKSQLDDDSEVFNDGNNAEGKLVITEWIATQKGLV